jgi:hypothetical protein
MINNLLAAMRDDRESILRADAFRSLIFIGLAASLIWFYISKTMKPLYLSAAVAFLILVDLWAVDRRYLNNDNYVTKSEYQNQFAKTAADEFILRDTDPNYRVLNLTKGVFQDAYTPYFHKSIGGYHGAKMRRYQDIIDGPLGDDLQRLQQLLRSQQTMANMAMAMNQLPVLNMLNTKYIIYNPDAAPIINDARYGNAWFVKAIKWVNNPDEEYSAVADFNPKDTAIIDKTWEKNMDGYQSATPDSAATIKFLSYKPNHLEYQTSSQSPQIAVFSEIFYKDGWNAYVDGKIVPHGRANFILRTMVVPAGEHKIDFKFEPKAYHVSRQVSTYGSVFVGLLLLFFAAKLILDYKNKNKE